MGRREKAETAGVMEIRKLRGGGIEIRKERWKEGERDDRHMGWREGEGDWG